MKSSICLIIFAILLIFAISLTTPFFQPSIYISKTDHQSQADGIKVRSISKKCLKNKASRLETGIAVMEIPAGALAADKVIHINYISKDDLPPMDDDLINVTKNEGGIRCLPHGTQFEKAVSLRMEFDTALIPTGYEPKDVRTYYFEEAARRWMVLPKDTLFANENQLASLTTHFTDFITGIIKVPDAPETQAMIKTAFKDWKPGNAAEGIVAIEPPTANSMGTANLQFPLKLPAGRQGMQPQVAFRYNSSGDNGWTGLGWDCSMPSIGIETRWGVPRYDPNLETETYTLEGSQLSPVAHRSTPVARTADKEFNPRVEGSFQKIVRYGDHPSNYYWVVTDKEGTRSFYGASSNGFDASAVLTDYDGNVAHWALREVRDLNGNFISYHYKKVNHTGVAGGTVPGYQLYIERITYTGFGMEEGKYAVEFLRGSDTRKDVQINARLGFKQVTADLLKTVTVSFNGQLIRSYELEYEEGAFYKLLLKAIIEKDRDGHEFYRQGFEYFDEVRQGDKYDPFKVEKEWTVPLDGIDGGLLTGSLGIFDDDASVIGGTKSGSWGVGASLTIGPVGSNSSKVYSVGGNFGINRSSSSGLTALVDINGDGLPDKVFKEGDKLKFRANLNTTDSMTFSSIAIDIIGIDQFSSSRTIGNSKGVEANLQYLFAGHTWSKSQTTTDVYFSDFNGDRLIDIAYKGRVYFNHIDSTGVPVFTLDSGDTPNKIVAGAMIDASLVSIDPMELDILKMENPLHDMVRVWEAPFKGEVTINAPVTLVKNNSAEANDYTHKDGVRVVIQFKNNEEWSEKIDTIEAGNTLNPVLNASYSVNKGDRFYFRVQSFVDGAFDQVIWNPSVQYLNIDANELDANNKRPAFYQASEDFVLAAPQVLAMPMNGELTIESSFSKDTTSDDIRLEIRHKKLNGNTTFHNWDFPWWDTTNNLAIGKIFQVDTTDEVSFRIVTSTNIDWSKIKWKPRIYYSQFENGSISTSNLKTGRPLLEFFPVADFTMFNDMHARPEAWIANKTETLSISPFYIPMSPPPSDPNSFTIPDGIVTLSAKGVDKLYGKKTYLISGSKFQNTDPFQIIVNEGDQLFFEYHIQDNHSPDTNLMAALFQHVYFGNKLPVGINGIPEDSGIGIFSNIKEPWLGPMYRGWGGFVWNGQDTLGKINEGELKHQPATNISGNGDIPNSNDGIDPGYDPIKAKYIMLYPDCSMKAWRGFDDLTWIMADTMSSSRFGEDDMTLDYAVANFSSATAPRKITKFKTGNSTIGVSTIISSGTGTHSDGETEIIYNVQDMNGDNYPDILSKDKVQFTTILGGLEDNAVTHNLGNQNGESSQDGATLGGTYTTAKITRQAKGTSGCNSSAPANNANTGTQADDAKKSADASVGLSASFSGGGDEMFDSWMDVNGDGLPDKVYKDGKVRLNLGYHFANPEYWNYNGIQKGINDETGGGASLGINYDMGSIMAGLGLSKTTNSAILQWQDVNGDGLNDIVEKDTSIGKIFVRLNQGNKFAESIAWGGIEKLDEGISIGESANGAFTICFPIFFIRVCINPNGSLGQSLSRQESQITDVDGDGFPDYITSGNDGELKVRSSTIGRTNLLKKVTGPMNTWFAMTYDRMGNTYEMPNSQWVLSSTEMFDGFAGDGVDTTKFKFEYETGYYDRREREFYGFKKVKTTQLNTGSNNAPYREVIATYDNSSYYTKGLMMSEITQSAGGAKYLESINTWEVRNLAGLAQPVPVTDDAGVYFPALVKTYKQFYEGQAMAGLHTSTTFDYDLLGNVIHYEDTGDNTPDDLLTAVIEYHNNIVSLPKSITVFAGNDTIRKREADIDNTGNVTQIRQYLKNGQAAMYDMEYDGYGNLTKITRPPNQAGQRLWFEYTWDDEVHTYATGVKDAYGYTSGSVYDYSFGSLLETTDMNSQKVRYTLDNRGRVSTVTGPNELVAGISYTIAFEYHPEAAVPFAKTLHYDPEHKKDIVTITFMDGLQRPLQIKKTGTIFNGSSDDVKMIASGRVIFDAFGRTVESYYPVSDIGENFNPVFNPLPAIKTTYDLLDRPLITTLPDGAITTMEYGFGPDNTSYSSFKTRVTDANGNSKEAFYDLRNRLRATKDEGPIGDIWTGYRYNAISELLAVIDDYGNSTISSYDHLGRRLSMQHPDAGLTEWEYDLSGMNTSQLTAQLREEYGDTARIRFKYDFAHLVQIDYPKNFQNQVIYKYGTPADTLHHRVGRMYLQQDASGGQEFFFDRLGEVNKTIRTMLITKSFVTATCDTLTAANVIMATYVWEAEYDTWNRVQKMVYPDGEVVDYAYNEAGKLRRMTGMKKNREYVYLDHLGYDEFEQRNFCKLGNGTTTSYTYEPLRRRLSQMKVKTPVGAGRTIMENTYTYDAVDNVTGIDNTAGRQALKPGGPASYQYKYDKLYRLSEASGEFTGHNQEDVFDLKMTYDNTHNIVNKTQNHFRNGKAVAENTYSFDYSYTGDQPHAPTTIGKRNYSYDANGNTTGWKTEPHHFGWRQIHWDEANRIMAISDNGFTSYYTYDASGERAIKSSGGFQSVTLDGAVSGFTPHQKNWTAYVSPYLVTKEGSFTKHYFIEGQRITSKTGSGYFENYHHFKKGLTAGGIDYSRRANQFLAARVAYMIVNKNDPHSLQPPISLTDSTYYQNPGWILVPGKTRDPVPGVPPGLLIPPPDTVTNDNVKAGYGFVDTSAVFGENNQYFFHHDHLGSTSYITDREGEVRQHLEYLPFGETFVEEAAVGGSHDWLFTGKEMDRETRLYYFGARYYDPLTSIWQSVDPMTEKYAGWSPYNYTLLNPVRLVDPDGNSPLIGALIGGSIGAIAGFTFSKGSFEDRLISAGKGAVGGVASGAIAGTFVGLAAGLKGMSALVANAAIGATSGAASNFATQSYEYGLLNSRDNFSRDDVVGSTITGAIMGIVTPILENNTQKTTLGSNAFKQGLSSLKKAPWFKVFSGNKGNQYFKTLDLVSPLSDLVQELSGKVGEWMNNEIDKTNAYEGSFIPDNKTLPTNSSIPCPSCHSTPQKPKPSLFYKEHY